MEHNSIVITPKSELSEMIREIVADELKKAQAYSRDTQSDELLTRDAAAELMKLSPTTLTKYVKEGKIRFGGSDRKYLFKKSDVDAFIFKKQPIL